MHPVKSDFLFVYSSLLKGLPTPDYEYISKYFNFISHGKTKGRLSIMENIVVGTPSEENEYITGELYEIKQQEHFSFAIGQLDEYEGVNPEPPQEPLYKRSTTVVMKEDGEEVSSWVYWYNGNVDGLQVVESGNMLDFIHKSGQ